MLTDTLAPAAQKAVTTAPPLSFAQAKDAYEAAKEAADRLSREIAAENAAVEAEAPLPADLQTADGSVYMSDNAIMDDRTLSVEQRERMLAVFREWRPRYDAAKAKYITDPDGDDFDLALDEIADAAEAVLRIPAPGMDALLFQIKLTIEEGLVMYIGEHADDERTISRLLTGYATEGGHLALLYRSALQLAGTNSPALKAKPFDAEAWVREFENLPGHAISGQGPEYDDSAVSRAGGPQGSPLWRGLVAWQQREVREFARGRANYQGRA